MTDTTTTTTDVSGDVEDQADVAPAWDLDRINRVPMGRWLAIRRHLELTTNEVLSDPALVLLVAANESHRDTARRDDWPRFEAMTVDQLGELFGLGADKSAESGA
jgi:hypothetical protein